MKNLVIRNDSSQKENILALIEHVKNIERENGLSENEIIEKYTRRDCKSLVTLINGYFPETKSVMFLLDEEDVHYVASLEIKLKKGKSKRSYFDIGGEKSFSDVCVFMFENFGRCGTIMCREADKDFVQNDITQKVLDSVECESLEPER